MLVRFTPRQSKVSVECAAANVWRNHGLSQHPPFIPEEGYITMLCPNNDYQDVIKILNRGMAVYVHAMGFAVRVINPTVMNKMFKRHVRYNSFEDVKDVDS